MKIKPSNIEIEIENPKSIDQFILKRMTILKQTQLKYKQKIID